MTRDALVAKLIDPRVLAHNPALSFTYQPYLAELFRDVLDTRRPLTLVIGAGVAMNAGLPSWPELIDRIISKIDDDELKLHAQQFRGGELRRAEFALQLVRRRDVNRQEHEAIRDGLYPQTAIARPGQLARSLARLIAMRDETRIITTNFDRLIEEALGDLLRKRIRSYGLKQFDEWLKANERRPVFHAHGVVRQDGDPVRPVILTESHYLKDGAVVRANIARALEDSVGLFIGLSLSDPNLLGPLYETVKTGRGRRPTRYAISVADLDPSDSAKSARLAVESVRFLDEKLRLRPVLVKSYSQVEQVISDLALAVGEPKRYSPKGMRGKELRYGDRIWLALRLCYEAVGCSRPPYIPIGEAASAITERLRTALVGSGGPKELLDTWSSRYGVRELQGEEENYGLHLWLRRWEHESKAVPYQLALIGSSSFESKEPWYIKRILPITENTEYAAVEAVYTGVRVASNVSADRHSRVWRGNVAVPIVLYGTSSTAEVHSEALDRVTVGVITLTSTRYVREELNRGIDRKQVGILGNLDSRELDQLVSSMYRAALNVLGTENP